MIEDLLEDITLGLSDAEKTDLEEMISAFKNTQSVLIPSLDLKGLEEQVLSLHKKISQYADILLKNDRKFKLLYEILRLSDQKTGIINQRIDAVMALLKGQNILIEE
jgi:hypothetical protein